MALMRLVFRLVAWSSYPACIDCSNSRGWINCFAAERMDFKVKVGSAGVAGLAVVSNNLASFYLCADRDSVSKALHVAVEEICSVCFGEANTVAGQLV